MKLETAIGSFLLTSGANPYSCPLCAACVLDVGSHVAWHLKLQDFFRQVGLRRVEKEDI